MDFIYSIVLLWITYLTPFASTHHYHAASYGFIINIELQQCQLI